MFPKINKTIFDESMDPGINSKTLRSIFKIMGVEYDAGADSFISKMPWGVCIADKHDNEKEPHYVLEVGCGEYADEMEPESYCTRYCDYHSVHSEKGNSIDTDPGIWIIRIWMPKDCGLSSDDVVKEINLAYAKAMEEELPEYEILYSSPISLTT